MESDWVIAYSTSKPYLAEMAKDMLEDHDIDCVVLNQQDSIYFFGDIDILVKPDDLIRAKFLLK
ncbi:MAG: DUF2007 domain-containing protein, partial [Salinivirgaceae bacterium]|nr:DUF2007 domain-containing protein [Salinivirgaceae bacterium]